MFRENYGHSFREIKLFCDYKRTCQIKTKENVNDNPRLSIFMGSLTEKKDTFLVKIVVKYKSYGIPIYKILPNITIYSKFTKYVSILMLTQEGPY